MKDQEGKILYVGKAANLRKRIASYFRNEKQASPKTQVMMSKVTSIDYLCTETEKEALLLESSLIKKHKPRYNIVLRDDKSYILFKLDKQSSYPRLCLTRRVQKDGSVYFGPFTSAQAARETLQFINRTFPLRKCSERTFSNRTRPCLQYAIGRCLGPCVYPVDKKRYEDFVMQVELFLKGKSRTLLQNLENNMYAASENLDFEQAAALRDQIRAITQTVEQQTVVFPEGGEKDIVGLANIGTGIILGIIFVRQGKMIDQRHFYWPSVSQEQKILRDPSSLSGKRKESQSKNDLSRKQTKQADIRHHSLDTYDYHELLRNFFIQFYAPGRFIPQEIILPQKFSDPVLEEILTERRQGRVRIKTARSTEEKRLVGLAKTNAQEARRTQNSQRSHLLRALNLSSEPDRIEAIDASHLSGQGMVVGQIVYESGALRKESYRIYSFPELEGTRDDYAALASWVKRRVHSGPPWPDLVLIDGGKGHLAAVERALQEHVFGGSDSQYSKNKKDPPQWECVAIAKGERRQGELEEYIYRPERKNPVCLKPGSQVLLFLQYLRDNVHRFVLHKQRHTRNKYLHQGGLETLPGVGPKTAKMLWDHFGSKESILKATLQELQTLPGIGTKRATKLLQCLQSKKG